MKYVLLICDGMADWPTEGLDGKTPLQVAAHPNMDLIASAGVTGSLLTLPEGLEAGSDIAILSILGYDPQKYYTGRGPLEAGDLNIPLNEGDVALRCNLVTVEGGRLKDYSAGHITTEEAKPLLAFLGKTLGRRGEVEFHLGVGFRHVLVLRGGKFSDALICSPPHDYAGKHLEELKVKAKTAEAQPTAEALNKLVRESQRLLGGHEVNLRRVRAGLNPANSIWPWSPGVKPRLPAFRERYGIGAAVISAVNLVNGIGVYAGMERVRVPGATGFFDTNYEGKADYALEALRWHDLVIVHVEAPDEAGHLGNAELKVRTIEDIDRRLLGRLLGGLEEFGEFTVGILPDHPTPVRVKAHVREPVPFAVATLKEKTPRGRPVTFDERLISGGLSINPGHEFMGFFLNYPRSKS